MKSERVAVGDREITKRQRYREIVAVLARHGFGVVDDRMLKHETKEQARAEHLRLACEELGTLFIKLGQALSTRAGILPPAYRTELAKMQDDVPPLPTELIAEVIEEDLRAAPAAIFSRFDDTPLGSASIGQVHAAQLTDGREVVVEVRKPGVDEIVHVDLEILTSLVDEWSPYIPELVEYDAKSLFRIQRHAPRRARLRARSHKRGVFPRHLQERPRLQHPGRDRAIHAKPRAHRGARARTTSLRGSRPAGAAPGSDLPPHRPLRRRAGSRARRLLRRPPPGQSAHQGRWLALRDRLREGRPSHARPTAARDRHLPRDCTIRRAALDDSLLQVTTQAHPVDRAMIQSEVEQLLELYAGLSLGKLQIGDALGELLELVRRNRRRLPGSLVLFFKALAMCEGLLQAIDPQASFSDYMRPMIEKMILQEAEQELTRVRDSTLGAIELGLELPERLDRILAQLERGNLQVWARTPDAGALMQWLERLAARINATILAAACVVGLAIVMLVYRPHGWQAWIGVVFWIVVVGAIAAVARALWRLRK